MLFDNLNEIQALEQRIADLTIQLTEAKDAVAQWTEASKSLSLNAAQERAKNQAAGRGLFGELLGSKFRGVMRAAATASNAKIAKEVAQRRASIADGKREAQELVRRIREELTLAKQELKSLTTVTKLQKSSKSSQTKAAHDTLSLLQKLKEARDAGLITHEEFEEKRTKLVADL